MELNSWYKKISLENSIGGGIKILFMGSDNKGNYDESKRSK